MSDTNWTDNSGYTHVELYPDGAYKSFVPVTDTEWVVLDEQVKLKADCTVKFFPTGSLEHCVLGVGATLSAFGVRVFIAEGTKLQFHESGAIRSMTLAAQPRWFPWAKKTWTYRGHSYAPGTALEFSTDGSVVK
jgi:hypothetical protein